jgi:hypothetical protein
MAVDFNKPVATDLELATRLPNERDMNVALATGDMTSAVNRPVGTINFGTPGGYSRLGTQWDGAAFTNFQLQLEAMMVGILRFSLSDFYLAQDIGNGNPGLTFDGFDYLDFNRAVNRLRLVIANIERLTVSQDDFLIQMGQGLPSVAPAYATAWSVAQTLQNNEALELKNIRFTNGSDWQSSGWNLGVRIDNTYMGAVRFRNSGVQLAAGLATSPVGVPTVLSVLPSGRTLIGSSVVDDGVTGLQVSSVRATNQAKFIAGAATIIHNLDTIIAGGTLMPLGSTASISGFTLTNNQTRLTLTAAPINCLITGSLSIPAQYQLYELHVRKNGVYYQTFFQDESVSTGAQRNFSGVIPMNTGDYIELFGAITVSSPMSNYNNSIIKFAAVPII